MAAAKNKRLMIFSCDCGPSVVLFRALNAARPPALLDLFCKVKNRGNWGMAVNLGHHAQHCA
jgi:hypothetical protein